MDKPQEPNPKRFIPRSERPIPANPELLTWAEAAAALNMSVRTLQRLKAAGEIGFTVTGGPRGRQVFFANTDIDEYLEGRRRRRTSLPGVTLTHTAPAEFSMSEYDVIEKSLVEHAGTPARDQAGCVLTDLWDAGFAVIPRPTRPGQ